MGVLLPESACTRLHKMLLLAKNEKGKLKWLTTSGSIIIIKNKIVDYLLFII